MGGSTMSDMAVFVEVAQAKGVSEGARRLGLPKSTVSRRLGVLEKRLGVQLLVRSTRSVSLTDVGESYLRRCLRILADAEDADAEARQEGASPKGRLRVTTPVYQGGAGIEHMMTSFLEKHPEVDLEVMVTNRYVDLVEEGFDVALRAGQLQDSALHARQLSKTFNIVVASPAYLAAHGTPKTAQDLESHLCVLREGVQTWRAPTGESARVRGRLVVNDMHMLRSAAVAGLGLALLPEMMIAEDLREGRLVQVLAESMRWEVGLYLVYPPGRLLSAKVRVFLDHAVAFMQTLGPPKVRSKGCT